MICVYQPDRCMVYHLWCIDNLTYVILKAEPDCSEAPALKTNKNGSYAAMPSLTFLGINGSVQHHQHPHHNGTGYANKNSTMPLWHPHPSIERKKKNEKKKELEKVPTGMNTLAADIKYPQAVS